jgi:hypothetical protein
MGGEGDGLTKESAERQSWLDAAKNARLNAIRESGQFYRTMIPFSEAGLLIYLYLLETIAGMSDILAGTNLSISMMPALLFLISPFLFILAFLPSRIDVNFDEEDGTIEFMRLTYRRQNRLCIAGLVTLATATIMGVLVLLRFAILYS